MQTIQSQSARFGTYLVLNTDIKVGETVKQAYIPGTSDKTKDVTLNLRHDVKKAYQSAKLLKWPPTAKNRGDTVSSSKAVKGYQTALYNDGLSRS